jgi:diguanylate cyclase (GGDEF)-like protein/PAS domain S-box-containing protein
MYPAMPLMLSKMQVHVQEFTTAATLAIDEANEYTAAPGQVEALRLFYDTLYAWSRTVDAFRLYVADRFGVFSTTPEAAMRGQATVVEDFSERIRRNFAQLDGLEQRGLLQFQQVESLREMQTQYRLWTQSWHEVAPIWISENWRRDRQVLQTTVLPIEKRVWDTVRTVEKAVDAHSARDLSLIAQLAQRLSGSLWLVVLMGLVLAGIVFMVFEIQIRRPIARVAAALKAEAAGEENVSVPETRLVETHELNQAFDHMRRQVRSRQERLQAVLDFAAEAIITIGERGSIEGFNPAAERLFGYRAAEVLGRNISLLMPEPERSRHDGYLDRYRQTGGARVLGREREEQALHKDGRVFPISLNVSEATIDGRRVFIGMLADISERKALFGQMETMLEQIHTREQRLHTILDNTAEGIITFDARGAIEGFNQSAEKLFGWAEDEVIGTSIAQLISPEARENRDGYLEHFLRAEIQRLVGKEGEVIGRHRDGNGFPMALKITGMSLEGKQKYIALVSNISERKATLEHLRRLAEHDGLTGLYNRSYFHTALERLVERVRRSKKTECALMYIDLDHFKYVNDTLGHAAGDKLLIEVANTLKRRARKSDLVARLGGDEFTVLIDDTNVSLLREVADSYRRCLVDYDFYHQGQTITVGCSIGVALIDPAADSPAEVMSRADLACHLAKRAGRNQVHVFSPEDTKDVASMSLDMGWSRRIREAIEHDRFVLAYQPIVSTRTRRVAAYEVLIRMREASGELIMPAGFLATAERFGHSLDIDRWVIVHAIEALAAQRALQPDLRFAINLSAQTLNNPAICDLIQERIAAAGIDPAALTFEITETVAITDLAAATGLLARLRALGCRSALDDFGAGMSSFAYLKELPVDIVKIDGRFVKHIESNAVDQAMVRAMNDIAHTLGKETVAEFVGTEAAFRKLVELGVDYGQGYHLGRPDTAAPGS